MKSLSCMLGFHKWVRMVDPNYGDGVVCLTCKIPYGSVRKCKCGAKEIKFHMDKNCFWTRLMK